MSLFPFIRIGLCLLVTQVVAFGVTWLGSGPVAFRVNLPEKSTGEFEPLLSVGKPGNGDIVFVRRLGDGRWCFGWEQTETGAVVSSPIEARSPGGHKMMVSLGSLLPVADLAGDTVALKEFAVVQLDGRTILAVKGKFDATPRVAGVLGKNVVGGSLATGNLSGKILDAESVSADAAFAAATESRALLMAGPAQQREEAEYPGPVRIRLKFPRNLTGRNEPIIVTGITSRGDFIFVRYEDEQHIRVGLDHWLVGGPLSEPVACDYGVPHELTISMGSLLAPADPKRPDTPAVAKLRNHGLVQLDGKTIIACASAFHPTRPDQITLGANRIGGSTAESLFYGDILRAERVSPDEVVKALDAIK